MNQNNPVNEALADVIKVMHQGQEQRIYGIILPEFFETSAVYELQDETIYSFGLTDNARDAIFDTFDQGKSVLVVMDMNTNQLSVVDLGVLDGS